MSQRSDAARQAPAREGRVARLRQASRAAHARLDDRIMAEDPFADRARYLRLLRMQHGFHRAAEPFFRDPALGRLLPDLAARSRLALVAQDLRDLGAAPEGPDLPAADHQARPVDLGEALGWLYVAEGSTLGAAFLLKEARRLGLSDAFGARHLAGHPEGRGRHWRRFTAALDAAPLTLAQEARAVAGATAAFAHALALVEASFA